MHALPVRSERVSKSGDALCMAEDVRGTGDDPDMDRAVRHQSHQTGSSGAAFCVVASDVGDPPGVFDIGI